LRTCGGMVVCVRVLGRHRGERAREARCEVRDRLWSAAGDFPAGRVRDGGRRRWAAIGVD
jgi:hypothetical protein